MQKFMLVLALSAVLFQTGCCTLIGRAGPARLTVGSSPAGAEVVVDGVPHGVTPATVEVSKGRDHTVEIRRAGYEPFAQNITHTTSGWIFGNIVFGGLIGLGIDLADGGAWQLSSDNVSATLAPVAVTVPMAVR